MRVYPDSTQDEEYQTLDATYDGSLNDMQMRFLEASTSVTGALGDLFGQYTPSNNAFTFLDNTTFQFLDGTTFEFL